MAIAEASSQPVRASAALPRSTPAEQGLDPAGVLRLLDALESADLELHSLMILRHGRVVVEGWWSPYSAEGLHLLYSLSKSFTSTAIGLAVEEGLLGVDDRVRSFFPDQLPSELHPHLEVLTVRHLLTMATGHREDTLDRLDLPHLVPSFFALAPEEEPGTWFTYNNGATLMLSAILSRLTGDRLLEFLRPRLLEPLGISEANWQGYGDLDLGFSGLHLPTEAVAKFGQLYLDRGRWRGRQLVPEQWVAEATRWQVDNPREPEPDWRQGYGYQFWMARHGYRGDGAFGQFCLVLPDENVVVAMTAATESMQAVLDRVWSELLPALQAEGSLAAGPGQDELTPRLQELSLRLVEGGRRAEGVALPWAQPSAGGPAGDTDRSSHQVVAIEETSEGWSVTLADGRASFAVLCGYQEWTHAEVEVRPGFRLRTAACAAWTGRSTFTAEVALLETPHRLILECDCSAGATTTTWNVAPIKLTAPSQLAVEVLRA